MKKLATVIAAITFIGFPGVHAATYNADPTHANISFTIKHLGINNVRGSFKDFSATIDYDGKSASSIKAEATIKVDSIDTANEKRDAHLKNEDFFDTAKHPEITFKTKSVHTHGNKAHLKGTITIKGVSKDIDLNATIAGPVDSPFEPGVKIIGFQASTSLDRQDFGVAASGPTDKLIGNTVNIEINVEAKASP